MDLGQFILQNFNEFLTYTAFANATVGNLIMIAVGAFFIWLAIKKDFEPLLLVPIGLGIILGNIPFRADAGLEIGLYEDNSVLNIFYQGVRQGWYPPLIFLGIGAMTDFTALLANPKLMLIGAAAQFGIFGAYMVALAMGAFTKPHGCHRCMCLFLHGSRASDSAIHHASAHHREGARHQDEAWSRSVTDRAYPLPHHRTVADNLHRAFRSAFVRYAVLR